ncbi:VanZ family protein [Leucobacter triazinivorans]|uniref:VanZ family protein n=1 Tax=Leucobacter triazinivorans TaxID=1784719 RepID=A0A4P6KJQ4_9MICO|nr:VanZ family protein [Leucobacter triazinivorans]QBE49854.1 VanZ family protein [Leucobacter triazinivorans]
MEDLKPIEGLARPRTQRGSAPRSRTPVVALFAVYLALLVWIVLWKLEVPHIGIAGVRQLKLVPFGAGAGFGANAPLEIAANVALFLPFGLYLGLIAPAWSWGRVAWASAGAALALETAQYVLAIGVSDTTDLIVNTAGGLIGFGLAALAHRRFAAAAPRVLFRACAVGTAIALIASVLFFLSPLHYAQRDVVVEPPASAAHRWDAPEARVPTAQGDGMRIDGAGGAAAP